MGWSVVPIVVAVVAAIAVITMITAMIVGSVRNTRGDKDWSHSKDKDFLPWGKDGDDLS
ncbi:hypothetical protein [Flindersiella endophytica]